MRETILAGLFLFLSCLTSAQTVPAGWKVIKDAKDACQIAAPPDWSPFAEGAGAVVYQDSTTAIAVVTSQPGQAFKQLTEAQLKSLDVPRDKVFENSSKRLFFQDRISAGSGDPNAFSVMVPGKNGTCSAHIVFVPSVDQETARKIVLSLAPTAEENSLP